MVNELGDHVIVDGGEAWPSNRGFRISTRYTGHTIDHGRVLLLLMPLFIMRISACLGGRTERYLAVLSKHS